MNHSNIILFAGVTFSYSEDRVVFNDLSLDLQPGSFYLVKGPSGAGKSTLLRLINRLEEPSAGEILFKGQPLSSYHPPVLRRSILYIQQIPNVIDGSVRDNLLLPFLFKSNHDLTRPDDDRLMTLLHDFLLTGVRLNDNAQSLSVGQVQRICFIRGLLLSPEILLLDEPTSALDEESGRVVESMAERLCQESGQTVLMISHKKSEHSQVIPVILEVADCRVRKI